MIIWASVFGLVRHLVQGLEFVCGLEYFQCWWLIITIITQVNFHDGDVKNGENREDYEATSGNPHNQNGGRKHIT